MAKRRRRGSGTAAVGKAVPLSDCFVLVRLGGEMWTGSGWTRKREEARRYDEPLDAYDRALADLLSLRAAGHRCIPFYFPLRNERQVSRSISSSSTHATVSGL
jgi:hypothetical protein